MSEVVWALVGGAVLLAASGWLVWVSVGTLAEGIVAVSAFIAVFALLGDELSDWGEALLSRLAMLPAGASRFALMLAGDALAVTATVGLSCLVVLAVRAFAPRRPEGAGPQAGG